jgi:hypothetical protein
MTFEELTRDDLIDAELISGINFIDAFEKTKDFLNLSAPKIRAFFFGNTNNVVAKEFRELRMLLSELINLKNRMCDNNRIFNFYKHWIILENIEDSITALETLSNFSLWSRSNRDINIYAGNIEVDYTQKQEETLEQIALDAGVESWYNIAVRNQLKEEDYSSEGGKNLKVIINNAPSVFLQSVVDQIDTGLKTYGIDISTKIEFNDDEIVYLSNKDTLMQSSNILLNLRKGDNPSLPDLGIDQVSVLGASRGSFLFPVIIRQLTEVFSTDDSFGAVRVGKIKFEQDAVFIEVEINSRYKETIEGLVQL